MTQNERLIYLIQYLLEEHKMIIDIPHTHDELFQLYRSLVNIREAYPISQEFLDIQDEMLKEENQRKGIVSFDHNKDKLIIWQGDITRLKVDAIVNAANNQMEGCFVVGHQCIDNAIHTFAGVQLRNDCHRMIEKQGYLEPTGKAKITKAYNLPSQYILHTVGPIVQGQVTKKDELLLASCYESCLRLAIKYQLKTIAFCCISTGIFGFPKKEAAQIAINTVLHFIQNHDIKIIFNVFTNEDYIIYEKILNN